MSCMQFGSINTVNAQWQPEPNDMKTLLEYRTLIPIKGKPK